MPGLQFENLPAAETQEIKDSLHAQWQIEANALGKTWFRDARQGKAKLAQLNAKYQQKELQAFTQLQKQQQERERVQTLIQQPQKRTRAEVAQLRMELDPEAERLVFPTEQQQTPFSIGQITSQAVMKSIEDFAEAAPATPEFWTRAGNEPKTKQGIINQYREWRSLIGYDAVAAKNPIRARQLDQQWDAFMAGHEKFDKWWLNKEKRQPIVEIKALRTPGDIGKVMRKRVVGATPLGTAVKSDLPRGPALLRAYGARAPARRKPAPAAAPEQKPIRQRNRSTGQERISYDGGRTWEIL